MDEHELAQIITLTHPYSSASRAKVPRSTNASYNTDDLHSHLATSGHRRRSHSLPHHLSPNNVQDSWPGVSSVPNGVNFLDESRATRCCLEHVECSPVTPARRPFESSFESVHLNQLRASEVPSNGVQNQSRSPHLPKEMSRLAFPNYRKHETKPGNKSESYTSYHVQNCDEEAALSDHVSPINYAYAATPKRQPFDVFPRKSAFVEGSMKEGSRGVASTWTRSDREDMPPRTQTNSNPHVDEIPPRSPTVSSIDVQEFMPPQPAPSTIKQTLGNIGRKLRSSTKADRVHPSAISTSTTFDAAERQLGRVRKTSSSWSIRNLPDKIKFFGSQGPDSERNINDVHDKNASSSTMKQKISTQTLRNLASQLTRSENVVVEDRKRRAEMTHAEQDETAKRQKDNFGLPNKTAADRTGNSDPPISTKTRKTLYSPSTFRKAGRKSHFAIAPSDSPSTLNLVPTTRPLAPVPAPILPAAETISEPNIHEVYPRRRPSRSELEKENQKLKTMLREARQLNDKKYSQDTLVREPLRPLGQSHRPSIRVACDDGSKHTSPKNKAKSLTDAPSQASAARISPSFTESTDARKQGFFGSTRSRSVDRDVPPVPAVPARFRHASAEPMLMCKVVNSPNWSSCGVDNEDEDNENGAFLFEKPATRTKRFIRHSKFQAASLPRPLSMVLEGVAEDECWDETYETDVQDRALVTTDARLIVSASKNSFDWDQDTF